MSKTPPHSSDASDPPSLHHDDAQLSEVATHKLVNRFSNWKILGSQVLHKDPFPEDWLLKHRNTISEALYDGPKFAAEFRGHLTTLMLWWWSTFGRKEATFIQEVYYLLERNHSFLEAMKMLDEHTPTTKREEFKAQIYDRLLFLPWIHNAIDESDRKALIHAWDSQIRNRIGCYDHVKPHLLFSSNAAPPRQTQHECEILLLMFHEPPKKGRPEDAEFAVLNDFYQEPFRIKVNKDTKKAAEAIRAAANRAKDNDKQSSRGSIIRQSKEFFKARAKKPVWPPFGQMITDQMHLYARMTVIINCYNMMIHKHNKMNMDQKKERLNIVEDLNTVCKIVVELQHDIDYIDGNIALKCRQWFMGSPSEDLEPIKNKVALIRNFDTVAAASAHAIQYIEDDFEHGQWKYRWRAGQFYATLTEKPLTKDEAFARDVDAHSHFHKGGHSRKDSSD